MDYPFLDHLMGCYYHEDFEDLWSPTDAFLTASPVSTATALVVEIDKLLAAVDDEAELSDITEEMNSEVYLEESPTTYREWLTWIRDRARAKSLQSA